MYFSLNTINTFPNIGCYNYCLSIMLAANQSNNVSVFIQRLFDKSWKHCVHLPTNCVGDENYFPRNKVIFAISFLFSKDYIVEFTRGIKIPTN